MISHCYFDLHFSDETGRYREQTSDYQWGEGREEGQYKGGGKRGLLWDYVKSCV